MDEQGHIELQKTRDFVDQRPAGFEVPSRSTRFAREQLPQRFVDFPPVEHPFIATNLLPSVAWQVDPSPLAVAGHVLTKIGKLQACANRIRKWHCVRVVTAAQMQDQSPHGVRRVLAIRRQLVKGFIASFRLILSKGNQQVSERVGGNREFGDRFPQRHKYRMPRFPAKTVVELLFPPCQQFQTPLRVGRFVGEIVRPTAVGINIVKMLP